MAYVSLTSDDAHVIAELNRLSLEAEVSGEEFEMPELRSRFTHYARSLAERGSARGHLMLMDLYPELRDREAWWRHMRAYVGDAAAESASVEPQLGFISVLILDSEPDLLETLLDGEARPWIRHVSIRSKDEAFVVSMLQILSQYQMCSLNGLEIGCGHSLSRPIIPTPLIDRVVERAPALHSVALNGSGVVQSIRHCKLVSLFVMGWDALLSLQFGPPQDTVRNLDLSFVSLGSRVTPSNEHVLGMLRAINLPSLQRLDLSRNEPGFSGHRNMGGSVNVFRVLSRSDLPPQLTHIRLPSPNSTDDVSLLQQIVARMDSAIRIEVANDNNLQFALYRELATVSVARPGEMGYWQPL